MNALHREAIAKTFRLHDSEDYSLIRLSRVVGYHCAWLLARRCVLTCSDSAAWSCW